MHTAFAMLNLNHQRRRSQEADEDDEDDEIDKPLARCKFLDEFAGESDGESE